MISLNAEQSEAVAYNGDSVVTACPGSGKTRVLTQRVARALSELESSKQKIVALTYTNRAADEIKKRLDRLDVDQSQLWAGTIHSFAIEWVVRPYAPYEEQLKSGTGIADEYVSERILAELRANHHASPFFPINRRRSRDGTRLVGSELERRILEEYAARLKDLKMLDYDDVLYFAYRLVAGNTEIARNISQLVRLLCVDEIQDTQDLQFGILSSVVRVSDGNTKVFCVGDADQAIYDSLGAVAMSPDQVRQEFALPRIEHKVLSGNYRSTQRIIDLYRHIRPAAPAIVALSEHAFEPGTITFRDQTVHKDDLPQVVAECIRESLAEGVSPTDICVAAPHWQHVRAIARELVQLLPEVDFDAPGLSPFHAQNENVWYKIARLFLTVPTPEMYSTRMRWAWEVLYDLRENYDIVLPKHITGARDLLRCINSIRSGKSDGLEYLEAVFADFTLQLGFADALPPSMMDSKVNFVAKAKSRLQEFGGGEITAADLRKFFRHRSGVTVATCHGVKGEEYDTLIAFGLLRGYVPNWDDIFANGGANADERESKLLYVLCSRAKRRLHLIAEFGRFTKTRKPYETASLLSGIHSYLDV